MFILTVHHQHQRFFRRLAKAEIKKFLKNAVALNSEKCMLKNPLKNACDEGMMILK